MEQQINKYKYTEEFRSCDFSSLIIITDVVSACTATIQDKDGVDMSASMLSNVNISTDQKGVAYKLLGGVSGNRYMLNIRITTRSNQKFEEFFAVCVL